MNKRLIIIVIAIVGGVIAGQLGLDPSWLGLVVGVLALIVALMMLAGIVKWQRKHPLEATWHRLAPPLWWVMGYGIITAGCLLEIESPVLSALVPWAAFACIVTAIVLGRKASGSNHRARSADTERGAP